LKASLRTSRASTLHHINILHHYTITTTTSTTTTTITTWLYFRNPAPRQPVSSTSPAVRPPFLSPPTPTKLSAELQNQIYASVLCAPSLSFRELLHLLHPHPQIRAETLPLVFANTPIETDYSLLGKFAKVFFGARIKKLELERPRGCRVEVNKKSGRDTQMDLLWLRRFLGDNLDFGLDFDFDVRLGAEGWKRGISRDLTEFVTAIRENAAWATLRSTTLVFTALHTWALRIVVPRGRNEVPWADPATHSKQGEELLLKLG
jgi:hypothetical protein